jgi:two-component system CheB/CheR fusion protein
MRLVPLWMVELVANVLMLALALYAVAGSRRIAKAHVHSSLWIYLQWQVSALALFATSHATAHILRRFLLMSGRADIWDALSPFTGVLNSMAFVIVGVLVFLYRDMRIAGEKLQDLEQARSELSKMNQALEKTQAELREANERLRETDRRKTQFLALLSHELRNPLTPILNGIHILERASPGQDQARRALAMVARQARHLTRLVDDLLDITRISRGKVQLQRERVDLSELARRIVEDHRAQFTAAGISVEERIEPGELYVQGDRTRLEQVVGNLLNNAIKFTGAGGSAVLSLNADARSGMAVLRVEDTGVGLRPEMLPLLFEPFVQDDRTLARSQGGLGLGLALVRSLVELHGGTVAAHSDGPGAGATFTVQLPMDMDVRPQPAEAALSPPSRRVGAYRRRVLVVEDNADTAESLRQILVLQGHSVEVAHDGLEGLRAAERSHPEAVLCDIGLPNMDGYEVARAVRGSPELKGAFLVALTGYALPEDQARAAEAGFDEHMAKPPDIHAIEQLLAQLGNGAARNLHRAPTPLPRASRSPSSGRP